MISNPATVSRRPLHTILTFTLVLSLLGLSMLSWPASASAEPVASVASASTSTAATAEADKAAAPVVNPRAGHSAQRTLPSSSTSTAFPAGTLIVDMGATQTVAAGLKPYGFVYEMLTTYKIPISWAIGNGKTSMGATDFTATNLVDLSTNAAVASKAFSGSSFLVSGYFAADVPAARLTYWKGQGVKFYQTTTTLNLPQFTELRSWPRIVLDSNSSSVADGYYSNAGIPTTAYRTALPSALTACDDLFVFPHADPTWALHKNLLTFNNSGGYIFGQCHAASVLENLYDTSKGNTTPDMNFLSTNGLVLYSGHSDGTPAYDYNTDWSDPVMQYVNILDSATTSGSETIYLPKTGGWRPSTKIIAYDPDHPQISGTKAVSPGPAAVSVYGRGFGNSSNGMVMYQGGHNFASSSGTANVAAQRSFLDFNLMAGIDRGITATTNVPNGQITGGSVIPVVANAVGGSSGYTYQWTSTCGGTFADATKASTTFTAPTVLSSTECTLRVTVTDSCGRVAFAASSVPVQQSADLSVTKTDSADPIRAGDALTYTITATNRSTLLDAASTVVTDVLDRNTTLLSTTPSTCTSSTSDGATTVTCALGTLAKGTSQTITIRTQSSTLTGADAYAGSGAHDGGAGTTCPTSDLCNRVSITSAVLDPDSSNNSYYQPTNVVRPGISLTKTVVDSDDADTIGSIGETLTYGFSVTNTGVLPLTNVKITDPMFSMNGVACVATLAPGAQSNCPLIATKTYVVKASDILVGTVTNTATATATPTLGADVVSSSTAVMQTPPSPGVKLTKTVADSPTDNDTIASFGEKLTYGFSVTNTGNVPLSNVTVTDSMLGLDRAPCVSSLALGATATCTMSVPAYTTTATDVENGEVRNTATARGTAPSGATTTGDGTAAIATETIRAGLSMAKRVSDASDDGLAQLGEQLTYKFTITNTGNVPISNVTLSDSLLGLDKVACVSELAVGASTTCPGTTIPTYTVKGADIERGSIANTASTAGKTAKGAAVGASAAASIPAPAYPGLALSKTFTDANGDGVGQLGEKLTYAVTVTNTGNVALSGVTVSDPLLGLDKVACAASLAVGASTTCPGLTLPTYTVTVADVQRGSVTNTATAAGTSSKGTAATATGSVTTQVPSAPGISLVKTVKDADNDKIAAFKEKLTYTFTITNTGNLPLSDVTLSDSLLGLDKVACVATLDPGASTTCPAITVPQYKVTDDDIDNGSVDNTATAAGTTAAGPVSDKTKVSMPTESDKPSVALTKTVSDADGDGVASLGEKLTYTFVVSNTGNVRLLDLTITDDMLGLDKAGCAGNLRADTSTTCSIKGTHVVTVDDIDSGKIKNTATVKAVSKKGKQVSDKSSVQVDAPSHPGMTLSKSVADSDDVDSVGSLGEPLTYTFTVTNTGDTTLKPVTVTDSMLGLDKATCVAKLAPGETTTCPALGQLAHSVSEADVTQGRVDNVATATGTPVSGAPVTAPGAASIAAPAMPALNLTKTVSDSADADSVGSLGETLTYAFTVTNPGNIAVKDVRITDAMLGLSSAPCTSTLAVGASVVCNVATSTYTVKASDVAKGDVTNTATATGTAADGTALTSSHQASISTEGARPGVTLLKTVVDSADADSVGSLGETLTYTFRVSNTGNVDLSNVTVTDAKLGLDKAACVATLTPGQTATCSLPAARTQYVVTAADLDKGSVTNTADVSATAAGGGTATDRGSATIDTPAHPRLELAKTVTDSDDADSVASMGEKLRYSFTVTNSGDVALTNVTVNDARLGLKDAACVASLAPGASSACPLLTVPAYTVTAADVSAGSVDNTATTSGKAGNGDTVKATGSASIPTAAPLPAVGLAKSVKDSADADSVGSVGEKLTYSFTVTNNGNLPLSNVTVTDAKLGISNAACVESLAVGASSTCPLLSVPTYTVTAADVSAGSVDNTATVKATPATGGTVSGTGSASMPTEASKASLALVKTVRDSDDADTVASLGEKLTYGFVVTNNGNQPLSDVTVTDPKLGLSAAPCVASLAPGVSATCSTTGSYTTQASDLQAGRVDNTATAKANSSAGTVTATGAASIATQETGVPPTPTGDGFNYDWKYQPPTCDALTVTYPADLPTGQANDVNIRFHDATGKQFTLNFHRNEGFWSGTTSFNYREHPNWPASLTRWTVEWTQVAGTNYHWEGAVECQLVDGKAIGVTGISGWRTGSTTISKGASLSDNAVTVRQAGAAPVVLEKQVDGFWQTVSTTVASTTGTTVISFPKETAKGTFAYRLRVDPTDSTTGTTTAAYTVNVT